jgi:Cellulase (glycosyl hydrolase family 5)
LTIATIMPMTTNRMIATCIQIQLAGMRRTAYPGDYRVRMAGCHPRPTDGRIRKLLLTIALGLLALVWLSATANAATSTPARAAAAPMGGLNITSVGANLPLSLADREIALARSLHAKLVRVEVGWSTLEPNGAGGMDADVLGFMDRLVSDAAANGIGVIATVDSTPCWASSAPAALLRKCVAGRASKANAWPPSDPSEYASFVAYLAARYGTRLAAIEVWNEPDQANEDYFAGPDKPQRYAAILRAAYPAIKQANAGVRVLTGSLVGSNGVFLRALYAAGIKGYEVQLANGDSTPLWLDEFGWSSCWPTRKLQEEQACVSPQIQGANIANLFRSLARTPYVAAEVLYKLQDSNLEDFGVLTSRQARKPAFAALAGVLANPFGAPSAVTLSLRRAHGKVFASGSGPVGDYMQLEVFRGATLRYRALFTLNRFNRYAIALPSVLGTSGLRVRVFQYWAGVARAAQRSI